MGLLDTLFTAGLTASITSSSIKNELEKSKKPLQTDKSIILSHEKSCLGRLCIDNINKENFERYNKNILQITKEKMGENKDNLPLYFIEYITEDDVKIDEIAIEFNSNCYQKQFKNSKFCVLGFNDIDDFIVQNYKYKLVKIHTEPIKISRGMLDADEELYLCEVVKVF